MALDVQSIVARVKDSPAEHAREKLSQMESLTNAVLPAKPNSILIVTPIVPLAIRLAFLQIRGANADSIKASLGVIESVIPPNSQPENFVSEIRRALVDDADWQTLWSDGCRAIQTHEFVRGCVLCIGGLSKAPTAQSLYMQVSMARNFEGFFKPLRSLYRDIVSPFFLAYWERTITESTGLFRTAEAYTQRQLQEADGTPEGTRRLLAAMRFCFGNSAAEGRDGMA